MQTYRKYQNKNVVFINLTGDGAEAKGQIDAYLSQYGIGWLNGYGAMRTLASLGVVGYPTLMVFGPDGRQLWFSPGASGNLEAAIDRALAGS